MKSSDGGLLCDMPVGSFCLSLVGFETQNFGAY